MQKVRPPYEVVVSELDLSMHPEPETAAQAEILAEVHRPFSLASGPWLRAAVVRLSPERRRLVLSLPHVVYDAWSMDIFYRELSTIYAGLVRGVPDQLPEPEFQYADATLWLLAEHDAQHLRDLLYWRPQLAGLGDRPLFASRTGLVRRGLRQVTRLRTVPLFASGPLAALRRRAEAVVRRSLSWRSGHGSDRVYSSRRRADVSADVVNALRGIAKAERVSLFAVMSAALELVLTHRTRDPDVVFATFTAGRTRPEFNDVMGPIGNTLVIRTHLGGGQSFRALVRRVHQQIVEAQDHGALPFPTLSAELARAGELPLEHRIPIVFQLIESLRRGPELYGAQVGEPRPVSQHRSSRLGLTAVANGASITMILMFDPSLYSDGAAMALLRDLQCVIKRVSRAPDASVNDLVATLDRVQ